ncbi:MAG TPA: hypothetical protein VER11_26715 [Polyangiaceae bacterium]|nr:hypothetical protein [Polyangiaceae bacterium]
MSQRSSQVVRGLVGVFGVLSLAACSGAGGQADESFDSQTQAVKVTSIDVRRSLVVTEQTILARFSLQRVLTQLAAQSGVPGLTATALFQQWWDTQNPAPGLYAGPHCDDTVTPPIGSTINGYPYLCRDGAEGAQASCDPFAADSTCAYIPIGLFNRYDQAPENGAHCGEYRIVYAKASGTTSTSDRNLLIFEAALPNPHPQQGLKGCQLIIDTWANLTPENDIQARATVLENFYFNGYGQGLLGPVISIGNFGDNALGAGQIRTNQFSNTTTGWSFREFKLLRTCTGNVCSSMKFVPVTDKNNAFGPLFEPNSTYATAAAFRSFFPSQVANLNASTIPGLDISTPDTFNTAQSQASGTTAAEMRYSVQFGTGESSLRTALQTQLTALGSTLTPDDIVARAQALSCAGCHRLSNNAALGGGLTWPASQGFTHVSERATEVVGGETRFQISDALINQFLPARQAIFEDFLNDRPRPLKGPTHPLSGSSSHG